MTERLPSQALRLATYESRVRLRMEEWARADFARRLVEKDPTLWPAGAPDDVASRLGWIDLPQDGILLIGQIDEFVMAARGEGIKSFFLVGMGGSSLAPEVFAKTFVDAEARPLQIIDSTHPDAVRRIVDELASDKHLFIVSSKSGSTLETQMLFQASWHAMERWVSQTGTRFAAITDHDSALEETAKRHGFRRVFSAPRDVGGRFSALSIFGLLPAAVCGTRIELLLERARAMLEACSRPDGPGLELGAALGELALAGRDKLTFLTSPALESFPSWLEQLIAESLGKADKGIVPVVGEPSAPSYAYGHDRVFVGVMLEGEPSGISDTLEELESAGHPVIEFRLGDRYDLGAEMVRWEVAVASAAAVLEVQPFDQPDVERTKALTREVLDRGRSPVAKAPEVVEEDDAAQVRAALARWLGSISAGDYAGIQAFLAPSGELEQSLRALQSALRDATGCAVTVGYGPRFLHSTGQLHKGGANRGAFLQLLDRPGADLLIPGEEYSFGSLIEAQAEGDAAALVERERRLLRVRLSSEPAEGVRRLVELLPA